MKKRITTNKLNSTLLHITEVDKKCFIVLQSPYKEELQTVPKAILIPAEYKGNEYFVRQLDNSFAWGNGYDVDDAYAGTLDAIMEDFDDWEFYQLDTLKEVFDFAFDIEQEKEIEKENPNTKHTADNGNGAEKTIKQPIWSPLDFDKQIKGYCTTNLDGYRMVVERFYKVPEIGDSVVCMKDAKVTTLRVVHITHSCRYGEPYINVELHH